ncbi:MAG TPA: hypothetical protein VKH43_04120 [Thermoanaerobaculia bacterium]|nr:hypothetical protein [Thermoanaerobaculia bacterium]
MKLRVLFSAILVAALAASASAQTGKSMQYSNAPTDTDYRLRIIEPKNGSTLTGKDVNIVLALPQVPQGNRSQSSGSDLKQKDMNTPIFQIWVDGKSKGNLPGGQNVFYARDLSYGPHKIVVMAKNASGEVVDRQEIGITTVESTATAMTATTQTETTIAQAAPAPAPPPPAPRAEYSAPPPAPAPAPEAPVEKALPHTASRAPLAVAAGFLLLAAGIALRFRA